MVLRTLFRLLFSSGVTTLNKNKDFLGYLTMLAWLDPGAWGGCCQVSVSLPTFQRCFPQCLSELGCPSDWWEACRQAKNYERKRDCLSVSVHIPNSVKAGPALPFLGVCPHDRQALQDNRLALSKARCGSHKNVHIHV